MKCTTVRDKVLKITKSPILQNLTINRGHQFWTHFPFKDRIYLIILYRKGSARTIGAAGANR